MRRERSGRLIRLGSLRDGSWELRVGVDGLNLYRRAVRLRRVVLTTWLRLRHPWRTAGDGDGLQRLRVVRVA